MGKDSADKKLKKDKKEKKEKRTSDADGIVKASKKSRKSVSKNDVSDALEAELEKGEDSTMISVVDGDVTMADGDDEAVAVDIQTALVPFAFPLAEESKEVKKILKTVKKSAKSKTLRRGVKEVVKALRKSSANGPSSSGTSSPSAIVIIAADISPMDVISHIPVLCEDHNIPYIYVKSRAELGEASATKRPTSVVMVAKDRTSKKAKDVKEGDADEFDEAYAELVKLVAKASKSVKK